MSQHVCHDRQLDNSFFQTSVPMCNMAVILLDESHDSPETVTTGDTTIWVVDGTAVERFHMQNSGELCCEFLTMQSMMDQHTSETITS
jgi:hypothetical protein